MNKCFKEMTLNSKAFKPGLQMEEPPLLKAKSEHVDLSKPKAIKVVDRKGELQSAIHEYSKCQ